MKKYIMSMIMPSILICQCPHKEYISSVLYKDASYLQNRLSIFQGATNKENIWDWVWNVFPLPQHTLLLEVGCGFGTYWARNIPKLPEFIDIILTDITPGMLKDCKDFLCDFRQFNPTYLVADIENLPFADNSFDIVFAHFVLYYTNSPIQALEELKRVVKPGGIVSIMTLHSDSKKEIYEMAHKLNPAFPTKDVILERFCEENADTILDVVFPYRNKYVYKTDIFASDEQIFCKSLDSIALSYNLVADEKMKADYIQEVAKQGGITTMSQAALYLCYKK